jgi:hypothetical protein
MFGGEHSKLAAQLQFCERFLSQSQMEGVIMSALADTEFLRMLKKDIDYFEQTVELFEDLIPQLSASVQDQWRLQAQSRRNFTLELMILLEKAEHSANQAVTKGLTNN